MIPAPRSVPRARLAAVALLALGIALRLIACLRREGLAGDELMLALNLATRGYRALLDPLSYAQTAPVPFLWAERLAIQIGGVDQAALRVLPFVTGCLVLVALRRVVEQWLTEAEALIALGLAATSPFLIDYSAEVKPYALDALMTVLVMASAWKLLQDVTNRIAWASLAGLGAVALVTSTSAPFVLVSVVIALAWQLRAGSLQVLTLRLAAVATLWVDVFVVLYQVTYRQLAADPYMRQYWGAAMLTPGPRFMTRWAAGLEEALWPVGYWMVQSHLALVLGLACGAGVVVIGRRHGSATALLVIGPLIAMLGASLLGRYPMAMRLTIFTAPLLIIAAAAGIALGARWLHRLVPSVRAGWIEFLVMVPSIMVGVAWSIRAPGTSQGMPAIVHLLEQRRQAGEPVYVFHRAIGPWTFYTTDWARPDRARLAWIAQVAGPEGPAFVNAPRRGPRRVGEGDSLVYSYRGRVELFGTASGVQGRAWLDPSQSPDWQARADRGWAIAEAARLRGKGRRVWAVFNADSPGQEILDLLHAIQETGGRIESRVEVAGTTLYSIRFGPHSPAA